MSDDLEQIHFFGWPDKPVENGTMNILPASAAPESLSDRLAKALLNGTGSWTPPSERFVAESLVPAVLVELLPEPDGRITDDGADVPYWDELTLLSRFEVWSNGVNSTDGFIDAEDITPEQVERAGRVLFAVAAEMRRHSAWKENGDG